MRAIFGIDFYLFSFLYKAPFTLNYIRLIIFYIPLGIGVVLSILKYLVNKYLQRKSSLLASNHRRHTKLAVKTDLWSRYPNISNKIVSGSMDQPLSVILLRFVLLQIHFNTFFWEDVLHKIERYQQWRLSAVIYKLFWRLGV